MFRKTPHSADINALTEDYAILVNIRGIHEEVYNKERFQDISVIIVDYYMGKTNGIEVCEALSNHPAKKLLLTGGIDKELVALDAFNKGTIHSYISKTDPNLLSKLNLAIDDLKLAYFRDLTPSLLEYGEPNQISRLQTPAYINFVKNLQSLVNAVEYYLIDSNGSYLFLDAEGEPTWFIVKHESELASFAELAHDQEASTDCIQALTKRQLLPFFFSEEDFKHPASEWEKFLHPALPLSGMNDYYYAIFKGHSQYLNHNNIQSYTSKAYKVKN